jgi:hypothetical protein
VHWGCADEPLHRQGLRRLRSQAALGAEADPGLLAVPSRIRHEARIVQGPRVALAHERCSMSDWQRTNEAKTCTRQDCYCADLAPGENCRNWDAIERRRERAPAEDEIPDDYRMQVSMLEEVPGSRRAYEAFEGELHALRAVTALTKRFLERSWQHSGSCCTFDSAAKVIITPESCKCDPLVKDLRAALAALDCACEEKGKDDEERRQHGHCVDDRGAALRVPDRGGDARGVDVHTVAPPVTNSSGFPPAEIYAFENRYEVRDVNGTVLAECWAIEIAELLVDALRLRPAKAKDRG